jgi:UDP-N-acetylmuramate--alanine ligase
MENQIGIAVAGTHGKTTTTAMIAWALTALKQDPSYIIGGTSLNLGNNAHAGRGRAFVIEADEYDRMFLGLSPKIAVITNIEHDHPDCYPTAEDFYRAFYDFAHRLEPKGRLVACADDPGAAQLVAELRREGSKVFMYGVAPAQADYQAENLKPNPQGGYNFTATFRGDSVGKVALQVPGIHNVRNALAALAVAHQMELPLAATRHALGEFKGTGRRFELRGEVDGIAIIDDYAHHPSEIQATLAAARNRYPKCRIWAVWQPHTYSRTQTLFAAFAGSFQDADGVVVTEVFASREASQVGTFSSQQVVWAMNHPNAHFASSLDEAAQFLSGQLASGDVMIVMSAGDADQISTQVLDQLVERKRQHV